MLRRGGRVLYGGQRLHATGGRAWVRSGLGGVGVGDDLGAGDRAVPDLSGGAGA